MQHRRWLRDERRSRWDEATTRHVVRDLENVIWIHSVRDLEWPWMSEWSSRVTVFCNLECPCTKVALWEKASASPLSMTLNDLECWDEATTRHSLRPGQSAPGRSEVQIRRPETWSTSEQGTRRPCAGAERRDGGEGDRWRSTGPSQSRALSSLWQFQTPARCRKTNTTIEDFWHAVHNSNTTKIVVIVFVVVVVVVLVYYLRHKKYKTSNSFCWGRRIQDPNASDMQKANRKKLSIKEDPYDVGYPFPLVVKNDCGCWGNAGISKFRETCYPNASEMNTAEARRTMNAQELRCDSFIMDSLKRNRRLLANHSRMLVSALVTARFTKRMLYTDVCWRVTLKRPMTLTTRTFKVTKVIQGHEDFGSRMAFTVTKHIQRHKCLSRLWRFKVMMGISKSWRTFKVTGNADVVLRLWSRCELISKHLVITVLVWACKILWLQFSKSDCHVSRV